MVQPITTTKVTGTVDSIPNLSRPQDIQVIGPTYSISVTLDDGSGTVSTTTLQGKPSVRVGDKVSGTVTDGPLGKILSEVTKI